MTSDVTERFFRSTGAATFSQVWRVGVAIGIQFLLRRWVPSDDWGLYEWVLPVFFILGGLRDLGLVYHVVRVKPRPYGNLLALELGWGGALVVATAICAGWIARGVTDPHLETESVIRAMTLFLFFEGIASVPRIYFDAELQVGRTVLPEILRNIVFAITSVSLALLGYGVWSLVAGQVLSAAVYAAHLWIRAWSAIPLRFERGLTWSLVRYSLPLGAIWILIIMTRHVDPLILGRRFPSDVIGNYTFAYYLAFIVMLTLVPAITRALYPALVAYKEEPDRLFEAYRLATLLVLAIEAPVAWFFFVNSEIVVRIAGGEQWVTTAGLLKILCFAPLIDPFTRLGGEILKVFHRDRLWILSSGFTLISFALAGWFLTGAVGPAGMAWANYLPVGGIVLMTWGIYSLAPNSFRSLLKDVGLVYLVPVLPFLAVAFFTGEDRAWLRFSLSFGALGVAFGLYAWRFGRAFVGFFRPPAAGLAGDEASGAG